MTSTAKDTHQDSSGVTVEDLDESHRRHKALAEGDPVAATITEVGIDGQTIYVQLCVDSELFVAVFEDTVTQARRFHRLCLNHGVQFQQDLTPLIGTRVIVQFDPTLETVTGIGTDEPMTIRSIEEIQHDLNQLQRTLPEPYYQSIRRVVQVDEQPTAAVISEIGVVEGQSDLQAHIDIDGEQLDWRLPVPASAAPNDASPFNQAIEQLGQGTVEGIEGARVFLVRTPLAHPATPMREAIDVIEGPLGKWWIFEAEYDARAAASRAVRGQSDESSLKSRIGWKLVHGAIYTLILVLAAGPVLAAVSSQRLPVSLGLVPVAILMGTGLGLVFLD